MTASRSIPPNEQQPFDLESGRLGLRLLQSEGVVRVVSLRDELQDHAWFASADGAPLAHCRVIGEAGVLAEGPIGSVDARSAPGRGARQLRAEFRQSPVRISVEFTPLEEGWAVSSTVENKAQEAVSVEVRAPWFEPGVGEESAVAMLPIEAGSVKAVADGPLSFKGFFGHPTFECAGSSMPLAHLGLPASGAGVAIVIAGPARPDQILECSTGGFGRRATVFLAPGEIQSLPVCHIIATDGDWRTAVDSAADLVETPSLPATPLWLKRSGAIYNPLAEGGGGIYQVEETVSLTDRVKDFRELPELLREAREFGTSVLQLFDYWDAPFPDARPAYWHKGDYIPRHRLGGQPALAEGVEQVHRLGGRVLLYLEPFIVYRETIVGREWGQQWAARDPWTGALLDVYPDNYTMPPWHPGWRQWIIEKARWVVGELGADGVFLDSFGWQWNWVACSGDDPRPRSAAAWNQATVGLAREVRQAIQGINPDAVVMTESLPLALTADVDGGLDASFAWNEENNRPDPLRSPVRRARPGIGLYTNGRTLAELHEVFANGLGLALSHRWMDERDHLRQLVELRQTHHDALIDGAVNERSSPGDPVFSMLFEGRNTEVAVMLNRSDQPQRARLPEAGSGQWVQQSGATAPWERHEESIAIAPGDLVALSRTKPTPDTR